MSKKIVVIGSGVGGAAAAAMLTKQGHDVTVLESHHFIGGRCTTLEREGFKYDFGVHMFSRGEKGPLGEVNRILDGDLKWITRDPACRVMGKIEFDFPLNARPLLKQLYLAKKLGVKIKNLAGAFFLFRSLMSGKDTETNNSITLNEYISRFTDDENIHLFINCVCQLYFAISYTQASAGEFLWSFSRMFNDAAFGYPAGGSSKIPGSFFSYLEKNGGKLRTGETVTKIVIENGQATGVQTAAGFYSADIVISNCGILKTVEIAGKENFPVQYVKQAENYRYSNPYVTIKYALNRKVVPYPVVFYMPHLPAGKIFSYIDENKAPEDPYLFMPVPTNIDPSLAPDGKQLVIAGTAVPPGASDELSEQVLDRIHSRVTNLYPDIEENILWQIRAKASDTVSLTKHPAGEAIGIGQFPDQVGEKRPASETPVKNLYLTGADTRERGIGTEIAAASAIRLVDFLKQV